MQSNLKYMNMQEPKDNYLYWKMSSVVMDYYWYEESYNIILK
jgi:hypothetical protein